MRASHRLGADAFVLCFGSFSQRFAKGLGIPLRIYPAKGYSVTLPVIDPRLAYTVSLTDDEYKLVFSRLGDRLRIAGTAEMNGYDSELNLVRCEAIVRRVRELFPGATDGRNARLWTGLRPATRPTCPTSARARSPTCTSTPGTARSVGRMPAAQAGRSPTS